MARLALFAAFCLLMMTLANAKTKVKDCMSYKHKRVRKVANNLSLDWAMLHARPGDLILLAPGKYYSVNQKKYRHIWFDHVRGTRANPITLCGPRDAILHSGSPKGDPVLRIIASAFITVAGITIQDGIKGVVIEKASHSIILENIIVRNIGMEGVHFMDRVYFNQIRKSVILFTGRLDPGKGEGVYIGSDDKFGVDRCYRNHVINNRIGPGVTAEMIDLKQNSVGSVVSGNILDGRDLCGCNFATSLINVKGNENEILNNIGKNAKEHMFKVSTTQRGQGKYNLFQGNKCLSGLRSGFTCVHVPMTSALPNRVSCGQRTNIPCHPIGGSR